MHIRPKPCLRSSCESAMSSTMPGRTALPAPAPCTRRRHQRGSCWAAHSRHAQRMQDGIAFLAFDFGTGGMEADFRHDGLCRGWGDSMLFQCSGSANVGEKVAPSGRRATTPCADCTQAGSPTQQHDAHFRRPPTLEDGDDIFHIDVANFLAGDADFRNRRERNLVLVEHPSG